MNIFTFLENPPSFSTFLVFFGAESSALNFCDLLSRWLKWVVFLVGEIPTLVLVLSYFIGNVLLFLELMLG